MDGLIRYEKYKDRDDFLLPMDFAISTLLGSGNWGAVDDPNYPLDRSALVSEQIRQSLLAQSNGMESSVLPRWIFTRRYQDYLHVKAEDKTDDLGEASHDSIINAIEKNQNFISLISHGSHTGLCFIDSDDIKNITNHSGIFFGSACNTAMFDIANDEAFAEWAILNPRGGAIAYVGESRMGSTGDGPLAVAFWEAFNSDRLGEMFDHSKLIANSGQSYIYNLLGDPAMRVWSDRPKQLNAVHPEEICTGHQTFVMLVTSNGQPIKDAVVCMTMEGTLFATCTTDASGKASRQITPSAEGTMKVTVSGKNLIPYLGSVTVKKCNSPGCSASIVCKNNLHVCSKKLSFQCSIKLVAYCVSLNICPSVSSGCPAIDPMEFDVDEILKNFEKIYEIWGVRDINEFARMAETPEIKGAIEQLPAEIGKPIRMMLKRIKKEKNNGELLAQF